MSGKLLAVLVAAVTAFAHPALLLADDRPAVFLHGFGAESSDWAVTADRLRQHVAIQPILPALSWRKAFQDQASELDSRADVRLLPATTVAIGHSNGGIVAREWSKSHPLNGIVTIGTPHRGVPLLTHFANWTSFSRSLPGLLNNVVHAFTHWSDWSWIYTYAVDVLGWVSDFNLWSLFNLGITLGLDAAVPVAAQMQPTSPYLASLNGGANLGREASSIANRVGIVTIAHNYYWAGPVRAIAPEWGDANAAAMYGAAAALLFWGSYIIVEAGGLDPAALEQGFSLIDVANHILSIDPTYCRMVSSIELTECKPNDGLVPYDSQMFPGAPNLFVGEHNDGPAHKQQKQMGEAVLYEALVHYAHVPPRSTAPPPAPTPPPGPDPSPAPAPPQEGPSHVPQAGEPGALVQDEVLYPGDIIDSENGRFHLAYQYDGNLVLYDRDWQPLWASDTVGSSPGLVIMQSDGNFVMYDATGQHVWSSGGSYGHPGAFLIVQNDGNLVIYDINGTPLWVTDTAS